MTMRTAIPVFLAVLLMACASPEDRVAGYLSKAQEYYDNEEYELARIEARNAGQIEPKNAAARVLMARMAIDAKEFISGHDNLLIALDSAPEDLEIRLLLGRLYSMAREKEKLEEQLAVASRLAPDDPRVRLLQAELHWVNRDYVSAEQALNESGMVEQLDAGALLLAADIKSETEGPAAAAALLADYQPQLNEFRQVDQQRIWESRLGYLVAAEDLDGYIAQLEFMADAMPDTPYYTNELMRVYVFADRADDAEVALRDIVSRRSDEVLPKIALVEFLAVQRGEDEARQALEEFIKQSPDAPNLRLALGNVYDAQDDPGRAMAEYEKTVAMAPRSDSAFEAKNRMVSILARRDQIDEASALIEEILVDRPADEEALLARASFNLAEGSYENVIADTRIVVRSNPKSARAHILLASAHQGLDQLSLAEEAYRNALKANPQNARAAVALANLLTKRGELDAAEGVVSDAITAGQQSLPTLESLVALLLDQREYVRAQEVADQILARYPQSGSGDFQVGQIIQQSGGSAEEALAAYARSLEKSPDSLPALEAFASLAVANQQYGRAIDAMDSFVEFNETNLGAQLLLARVRVAAGDVDQAKAGLVRLTGERPEFTDAYVELAGLYPEGSAERFEALEGGIDSAGNASLLAFVLGNEYERAGLIDEAVQAYERALSSNDANDAAANNLAMLLLNHRDDDESHREALSLATRFSSTDVPGRLDTLGWAHYRNEEYVAAVRYLERAVAGQADNPELRFHLGMAYLQTGDRVRARMELQKALEIADATYAGKEEAARALESLGSA